MRISKSFLAPVLAVAAFASLPLMAQQEFHLSASEGLARVKVAVPGVLVAKGSSPRMQEAADEIREVLIQDLGFAWRLDLIEPAYYKHVPGYSNTSLELDTWLSLGASALMSIKLRDEGGELVAEGRLFDTKMGEMIMGKRLRGEPRLARLIAHTYADAIVRHFTGYHGSYRAPLAYVSTREGRKTLFTSDYDGHNARRVLGGDLNILPSWSPDVKSIVFTSFHDGPANLYMVDRYGTQRPQKLTAASMAMSGILSPDGKTLLFAASDGLGNMDIYTQPATRRSRPRRLTALPSVETAPAWSPSGREIAFTSDRGGSPQIYVMDAEGANVRRISWAGSYYDAAEWSPDGSRLAATSRAGGRFHIVVFDLALGEEIQLTHENANHESPSWSPDGSMLAYASNRTGRFQIYIMRSDGTRQTQITRVGENQSPAWAPRF